MTTMGTMAGGLMLFAGVLLISKGLLMIAHSLERIATVLHAIHVELERLPSMDAANEEATH